MLVRCNLKCRLSDGQTDASLDVDSNKAMCNTCGDVLTDISEYTRLSMKANGDVLRSSKSRKAFVFPCNTCSKDVEAHMDGGVLVGKACVNDRVGCQLNITESMLHALKQVRE